MSLARDVFGLPAVLPGTFGWEFKSTVSDWSRRSAANYDRARITRAFGMRAGKNVDGFFFFFFFNRTSFHENIDRTRSFRFADEVRSSFSSFSCLLNDESWISYLGHEIYLNKLAYNKPRVRLTAERKMKRIETF